MLTQWLNLAITAIVVLGGTGLNLFILGRVVGKWEGSMKTVVDALQKVEKLADEASEASTQNHGALALLGARMDTAEAALSKFWQMRDEFVALRTTIEIEGKNQREKMDSIARSQGVMERQLANMVSTKAGFTTLSSENKN